MNNNESFLKVLLGILLEVVGSFIFLPSRGTLIILIQQIIKVPLKKSDLRVYTE